MAFRRTSVRIRLSPPKRVDTVVMISTKEPPFIVLYDYKKVYRTLYTVREGDAHLLESVRLPH